MNKVVLISAMLATASLCVAAISAGTEGEKSVLSQGTVLDPFALQVVVATPAVVKADVETVEMAMARPGPFTPPPRSPYAPPPR